MATQEESAQVVFGRLGEALQDYWKAAQDAKELPAQPPVEIPTPAPVDPNDQGKLDEALAPFKARIAELEAKQAERDETDKTQADIDAAVKQALAQNDLDEKALQDKLELTEKEAAATKERISAALRDALSILSPAAAPKENVEDKAPEQDQPVEAQP